MAPATTTFGETFVWHRPLGRLQVGVALLWKQGAFRGLANYEVIKETAKAPNLRVGFGVQGIGTGNPGYFATSEKTFAIPAGALTGYLGIGYRSNEDHAHGLAGVKFTPTQSAWTIGLQLDGHWAHPFAAYRIGKGSSAGAYLVEGKSPGLMVSWAR
ncbi:MAG: hypothetical protein H7Y17_13395 [Chlorobia bacterium]|nr:hypothetical protein [Fimbriimonadaceae bacterium]